MPGFVVPGIGGGFSRAPSSRREYYYNYTWEVENLFQGQSPDGWSDPNSPLIALRDATLPTFTVNKEVHAGASVEYKYAKSVTWDDIKITWYDSDGLLEVMRKWRGNIWTQSHGLADADHYKRRSELSYYLPTGKKRNSWLLRNSWPSQIRHGELTYTSSDVKLVEVTVTYDWAIERPSSEDTSSVGTLTGVI